MKKLFTLFMALSLIAGLNAAPLAALSQKKVVKTEKVEKVQKQEVVRVDKAQAREMASTDESFMSANRSRFNALPFISAPKKEEANPIDLSSLFTEVIAEYRGTMYAERYYMDLIDWVFYFGDGTETGNLVMLDVEGEYADKIAGSYVVDTFSALYVNGVAFKAEEGSLTIEYVDKSQEGNPIYRFSANILARDGNTYTFTNELEVVDPYDYYYSIVCEYYKDEDACSQVLITLLDAPADPYTENIVTELTAEQVQALYFGDQYSYSGELIPGYIAFSFSTEDYEGAAALTTKELAAATFTPEDITLESSSLYVGEDEAALDSISGQIADNGDGTFTMDFIFYPRYGGYSYEFIGTVSELFDVQWGLDAQEDVDITITGDTAFFNFIDEGYVLVRFYDEEYTSGGGIYFNFAALDPNTTVPAGTYTIDDTMDPGTCDASTGYTWSRARHEPVYVIIDEKVWYVVEGTVVVSGESGLRVEVTGKNHNGFNVHFVFDLKTSGIEEVIANTEAGAVRKFINNGQIMVVRDGKVFNILGARVK